MIDLIFQKFILYLQTLPSIFITFLSFIFCSIVLYITNKKFGYVGLCCYISLSTIIANIQILYVTSYDFFNTEILLGTVIFCSSFFACDIINANYGPKKAKKAIYLAFLTDIFFLINIILTLGHKPIDYSQSINFSIPKEIVEKNISSINTVFLPIPRLLIASYITYLISQISEIYLFNFIKKIKLIKIDFIKHNIALFISSVCIDTFVFTALAMCLMTDNPLSFRDFNMVCYSTISIRVFCNFINILTTKLFFKFK